MIVSTVSLNTAIPKTFRFQNAAKSTGPVKEMLNQDPLKQSNPNDTRRFSPGAPIRENLVSTNLDDILRTPIHSTRRLDNFNISSPSWEALLQAQQKMVDARNAKSESMAQIEQQRQQAAYQLAQQQKMARSMGQKIVYDSEQTINELLNRQESVNEQVQTQSMFSEAVTVEYEPVPLPGTGSAENTEMQQELKNPGDRPVKLTPGEPVELESRLPEKKIDEEAQVRRAEQQQKQAQELAGLQSGEKPEKNRIDYFI